MIAGLAMLLMIAPARATDTFSPTASMAEAREAHTATRLEDGRVLVAGGMNATGLLASVEIYNPALGAWEPTGSLLTARSGHTAVRLLNGRVLVVGGRDALGNSLASAELFNPATGAWTVTGTMRDARQYHTANLLPNGRVLVVGGALDDNGAGALETSEYYQPATGSWVDAGLVTHARGLHTTTLINDTLIIFGGMANGTFTSTMELYDTRRSQWDYVWPGPAPSDRSRKHHTVTRLPNYDLLVTGGLRDTPLATTRLIVGYGMNNTGSLAAGRFEHTATMLPDGRVLAVGGRNSASQPTATTEIYRRTNGGWSLGASLSTARTNHTATPLAGGAVLIIGGTDDTGALASCEIFSPTPAELTEGASMLTGRQHHRAVLLPNGNVLISGGFGWGQSVLAAAEVYHPTEDRWSSAPGVSPRAGQSFTLLPNGLVLMAGGHSDMFGSAFPAATTLYDPARNQWTATGPLHHPRGGHAAVLLPDGKVLVVGGGRGDDLSVRKSAEIYDPATGLWSLAAPMAAEHYQIVATLLPTGKVLVVGGSSAEVFDPQSGTWSSAGTLLFPHDSPSATLLHDGRVLVAGGYDPSIKGTSEIYDPITNSWSPAATMTTDAFSHAASLLQDGRVLIAGNYSLNFNNPAGKAEIYNPATDTWTSIGQLTTVWHTLTQLKGPRTLIAGGDMAPIDPYTNRARLYHPDAAFGNPVAPSIASVYWDAQDRLVLAGSGLTSDGLVAPVVHLRRLDNGHTQVLSPDPSTGWSESSFTSQPLTGQPQGHAMVTVFTGGRVGASVIIEPQAPEIGVVDVTGTALAHAASLGFGAIGPGEVIDLTLVIHNHGRSVLSGLAAVVTGRDANAFTVLAPAIPSELAPASTAQVTVRFSPTVPGPMSAMLRLTSNDADESTFDLYLNGVFSNSPPSLSPIANQSVAENETTNALAFSVQDAETPAASLVVTATSSNVDLIPPANLLLGGVGAARTLTIVPAPHQNGSTLITVTVSDGVLQSVAAFTLTVTAVNAPPTLDSIANPDDLMEDADAQSLLLTGVGPGLGDTEPVTLSATSSNPALIPHPVVASISPATTAVLSFAPVPGMSGSAEITVAVSDGQADSPPVHRTFTVRVRPRIRLTPITLAEGDSGVTAFQFRLHISAPQSDPVEIQYATASGTATAAADYDHTSGTAIIPPGAVETVVAVPVTGDTHFELDESFSLVLSNPVHAYLTDTTATAIILNDDPQPPLQIVAGSVTESPGSGPFQIWFSASIATPLSIPVTWNVTTRAGTAEADHDFTPLGPLDLTFAPGETTKWISIHIPSEASQHGEEDEEFFLDFTTAAGPAATTTTTGTIRPLKIIDFRPLGNSIYVVRFPTGNGQRYLIEESSTPAGPWSPASAILFGTGSPVTQVLFSDLPSAFFRAVAAPAPPN